MDAARGYKATLPDTVPKGDHREPTITRRNRPHPTPRNSQHAEANSRPVCQSTRRENEDELYGDQAALSDPRTRRLSRYLATSATNGTARNGLPADSSQPCALPGRQQRFHPRFAAFDRGNPRTERA